MKLYTEEQVFEMIEKSRSTGLTADYLILTTTPIELPSSEDINKLGTIGMHEYYIDGLQDGAKWVIEQITKTK